MCLRVCVSRQRGDARVEEVERREGRVCDGVCYGEEKECVLGIREGREWVWEGVLVRREG